MLFIAGATVFVVGETVFATDGAVSTAEPPARCLPTCRPRYVFAAFG